MKLVLKITLGIILGAVLLVAGCTALIGAGASEVAKDPEVKAAVEDLNDLSGDNDAKYKASMQQIELGMTKAEVISIAGKPRDVQRMRSELGLDESLYYGSWQLNFTDGVLESKNRY